MNPLFAHNEATVKRFLQHTYDFANEGAQLLGEWNRYHDDGSIKRFDYEGARFAFRDRQEEFAQEYIARLLEGSRESQGCEQSFISDLIGNAGTQVGELVLASYALSRDDPAAAAAYRTEILRLIAGERQVLRAAHAISFRAIAQGPIDLPYDTAMLADTSLQLLDEKVGTVIATAQEANERTQASRLAELARQYALKEYTIGNGNFLLVDTKHFRKGYRAHLHGIRRAVKIHVGNREFASRLFVNDLHEPITAKGFEGAIWYLNERTKAAEIAADADEDTKEAARLQLQHDLIAVLANEGLATGELRAIAEKAVHVSYTLLVAKAVPALEYALQLQERLRPGLREWFSSRRDEIDLLFKEIPSQRQQATRWN